tara:strand:- start:3419 stop:4393 length:975 start_codon:yes stop_codon:yes gene_type:complete
MFKRYKNINIPESIISTYFEEVGKPLNNEDISISSIWEKVFNKYDKSSSRDLYNESTHVIADLYENFFQNGLSEGACAGQAMNEFSGRYKIMKREKKRLSSLFLHLNPGVNKSYSRFSNSFKANKEQLKLIANFLSQTKLSRNLFSGNPWMNNINGEQYLLEIVDHYFFSDIINRYDHSKSLKPIFIGEGSGILSNILLNYREDIKDSIFIDLGHFLLRQYIVNFELREKVSSYVYAQDFETNNIQGRGYTIINQDSFPEIPEESLQKYFQLIQNNIVSKVISYNHLDLRGHSNYREMLVNYFGEPKVRFESPIRPGYFVEIFD